MLKMVIFGLLQTLFFAFILKGYLNLSWQMTLVALLTIFILLSARIWSLVKNKNTQLN